MKFTVTMKDPDTLYDAIEDAVIEEVNKMDNLDEDEREDLIISRREKVAEICEEWFSYSEYLTVEIDTEAKTAVVSKVGA